MAKIIVSIDHSLTKDKLAAVAKEIADGLGVMEDDILVVRSGVSVAVVDVPAAMLEARKKRDAEKDAEAKKAAEEAAKAAAETPAAEGEPLAPKEVVHKKHKHGHHEEKA